VHFLLAYDLDKGYIDEDEFTAHEVAATLLDLNQKPAESLEQKLAKCDRRLKAKNVQLFKEMA